MTLRVLHVVRRFGRVGGMEAYVWHLTHELANLGLSVEVLCQSVEGDVDPKITLHRLQPSPMKRRWKAMRDFRQKCDEFWWAYHDKDKVLVHSHERCSFHHVTTFHGPPMKAWPEMPWYQKISPRVRAWHQWEASEVCGGSVRRVVPVSTLGRQKLAELYPDCSARLVDPIEPGLISESSKSFSEVGDPIRAVFVGKEWKRKGLVRALAVLATVRSRGFTITLDVFGPVNSELRGLHFADWVSLRGWSDSVPYSNYDVLIHPAVQEPFGMVVPEALVAGCRVLLSENVGAASINHECAVVMSLECSDQEWGRALLDLVRPRVVQPFKFHRWSDVAKIYLDRVYICHDVPH
ncbi:glycosyltransferase family 4 protein [Litorivicinus sp.]|nr:glycosyltransferase family 4 protein [Litorivicinus sp.]